MKTDLVDKILIILLIVMLPIGVVVSYRLYSKQESAESLADEAEKLQKIDSVIAQMKAANEKPEEPEVPPIVIGSMDYASESGKLTISGTAPGKNLNVFVSAIVTKHNPPTPTPKPVVQKVASGSATASGSGTLASKPTPSEEPDVLGDAVEVKAVKTDENGKFVITYKVDPKEAALIDLKFDQAESTTTVQYNFVEKQKTL